MNTPRSSSPSSTWRLIALSAWSRPRDPSVYGWLDLDVSRARAYLEARRSDAQLSRLPAALRTLAPRAVESAVYDWRLDLTRFGVPRDAFGSAMLDGYQAGKLAQRFSEIICDPQAVPGL